MSVKKGRYQKFQNIAWVTRVGPPASTVITVDEQGDFTIISVFDDNERGGTLERIPRAELRLIPRRINLALEATAGRGARSKTRGGNKQ